MRSLINDFWSAYLCVLYAICVFAHLHYGRLIMRSHHSSFAMQSCMTRQLAGVPQSQPLRYCSLKLLRSENLRIICGNVLRRPAAVARQSNCFFRGIYRAFRVRHEQARRRALAQRAGICKRTLKHGTSDTQSLAPDKRREIELRMQENSRRLTSYVRQDAHP